MKHKILLCSALMSLAGTVCADIVEDNTYGYKYTNNSTGIYSPGGAGTVGNQRYDLYIQNIAQGKPAQARTVNNDYPIAKAVDGDTRTEVDIFLALFIVHERAFTAYEL